MMEKMSMKVSDFFHPYVDPVQFPMLMKTVMRIWKKKRKLRATMKISVGITPCRGCFGVWCVMLLPFASVSYEQFAEHVRIGGHMWN
ncbi:hypothetical protein Hanom_Chr12g01143681 [Helianthus anomalus]